MQFNGIKLVEGSEISSLIVQSGSAFPPAPYVPTKGELFYKTLGTDVGLYIFDSVSWVLQLNSGTAISGILPSGIVTPGTYRSVTVDTYGRTISGSNPTSLAGYGITDAQMLSADLSQIALLTGGGTLKRLAGTASSSNQVWGLDSNSYLTQNQQISLTGDATGFGTTSIPVTLAPVLNVAPGTFGSASTVPVASIDIKGRTTHVINTPIAIDASALVSGFIPDARISPSSISQFQNQVAINESQITNGTILARVADNELITGTWSFINTPSATSPTLPSHLANKEYVDAAAAGISSQRAVDVATTTSISLNALQIIDGVQLVAGNRVLVKDQISLADNGIYVASSVTWTRAADFDNVDTTGLASTEVKTGALVYVSTGTANGNSSWVLTTPGNIILGTSSLTFTIFSRPGDFVAGAGLTLTNGHQFDVGTASTSRIVVNADSIDLATTGITANTYSTVTVDSYGRVNAGSTTQPWSSLSGVPTTIAGYGLTAAVQPLDANLTALAALSSTGIMVKTGSGSYATRALNVSGIGISLANGDGTSGNPTITSNATDINTGSAVVSRNASGNFAAGIITAALAGNATTATALQTGRTISLTNDISGTSTSFDGSGNVSITATLPSVNASVGSYGSAGVVPVITVNAKGLITGVSTAAISTNSSSATITDDTASSSTMYPTWVSSTGTAAFNVSTTKLTYVPATGLLSATKFAGSGASLTSIPNAALVNSSVTIGSTAIALGASSTVLGGLTSVTSTGFTGALTGNASTATTLATGRTISASGDATGTSVAFDGSSAVSIPLTLATIATPGTYNNITVNAKGLVTSGSNAAYLTSNQSITINGDASGAGASTISLTLASVGSAGTYTKVTTDSKGRVISGTSLASSDVTTALGFTPTNAASAGIANGYATLNASGQLTPSQIPSTLLGTVVYQGVWNAFTNTPTITAGVGTKGYYYKVNTAGTTSIDGNSAWTIGDMIIFNGTTWDQIQGGTSDVSSVFGRIGAVTLLSNDVTTALGFTPYNATNPSGYITSAGSISGNAATASYATNAGNVNTTGASVLGYSGVGLSVGTAGGLGPYVGFGTTTNAAGFSLHRSGAYAINVGLDTDNVFRIGGWSDGGGIYRIQLDSSGNLTARGDITAYSDERLKKDWQDLSADFTERLASVKMGTFTRIDTDDRQVGVSAQSLQALLPEAVQTNNDGLLSVAYGNAALAACIMLAQQVEFLKARIEELEAK